MPSQMLQQVSTYSMSKNLCLAQKNKFLMRELTTPIGPNIRFRKSPGIAWGCLVRQAHHSSQSGLFLCKVPEEILGEEIYFAWWYSNSTMMVYLVFKNDYGGGFEWRKFIFLTHDPNTI